MRNKLTLLLLLLLVSCKSYAPIVAPVAMNSGFEGGWHLATTFWTPEGGPYHYIYQEVTPPEEWTAWWHEGFSCDAHPSLQGRPEVRAISTTPDPTRVHSGDQAVQFFTFWRCHRGGLYQQVTVEPGKHYTAQAYGHAWYSECSTKPHSAPYEKDCKTPLNWAQLRLRIGLDPLGGINPIASSVEWSTAKEIYGEYGSPLRIEHVLAISNMITLFVESDASHPLKHVDVYWDDVSISESYQVFIPLVRRD